jgi:hypothetical protein
MSSGANDEGASAEGEEEDGCLLYQRQHFIQLPQQTRATIDKLALVT